jgi:hypothetical protein
MRDAPLVYLASHLGTWPSAASLAHIIEVVSAVRSLAQAGTVCPRFHLMFALTHFPIRTSTCSLQYIEYYLDS